MNKTYKLIWNESLQQYTAVSEITKSRTKSKCSKILTKKILSFALLTLFSAPLIAEPLVVKEGEISENTILPNETSPTVGQIVLAGGTANSTIIGENAIQEVYGTAHNTSFIGRSGQQIIYAGGEAHNTTLNAIYIAPSITVHQGGAIYNTTFNGNQATVFIKGGLFDGASNELNAQGATQGSINLNITGGDKTLLHENESAQAGIAQNINAQSAFIKVGAQNPNELLEESYTGILKDSNFGHFSNVTLYQGAYADNLFFYDMEGFTAGLTINNGATANNITTRNARIILRGGSLQNAHIDKGTRLSLYENSTMKNITIEGVINESSYASIFNVTIKDTLIFDQSHNTLTEQKLTANLLGDASLVKNGNNKLSLYGNNHYSGGTYLNNGTLQGNTAGLQGDIFTKTGTSLIIDENKDSLFTANIIGDADIYKTGTGLVSIDSLLLHNLTIQNGGIEVLPNGTLFIQNELYLTKNTALHIAIHDTPSVQADTIHFEDGSTLNISQISVGPLQQQVIVQTQNGITGNYNILVDQQALSGNISSLDDYVYGDIYQSGNDIMTDIHLAWNHETDAHGTFNIQNDFTINGDLQDNTSSSSFNWDGQSLTKEGQGILTLNGHNQYSGPTTVNNGTLLIGNNSISSPGNSAIHSNVIINNQGSLGGNGVIYGNVTLNNGATLISDNQYGALSTGQIYFAEGSQFRFELNDESSSNAGTLIVNSQFNGDGTVTIADNTTLIITGSAALKPNNHYTLIKTDNGIDGTFSIIEKDTPFLDYNIHQTNNDLYLQAIRSDISFASVGITYNQQSTARGIESLGLGNSLYDDISSMNANNARYAFDQLSGEIHASAKAALLANSQYVQDSIITHLNRHTPPSELSNSTTLWGDTWGHKGKLKANDNAATLKNSGYGFLIGSDLYQSNNLTFGVAAGYEHSSFKSDDRNSRAKTNTLHLLTYGSTQIDQLLLTSGIGYSIQKLDTERYITLNHQNSYNSTKYDANAFQFFIAGKYTISLNESLNVSPYLNLSYQQVKTDDFIESGTYGNLIGYGDTTSRASSILGIESRFLLSEQSHLTAAIGWKHRFNNKVDTKLSFIGGSKFDIRSPNITKNSIVIGLGADFSISQNSHLSLEYQGEYGKKMEDNRLKAQFNYHF